MKTRSTYGASLALIAACSMIIILVGIGLFFIMQQFGGFREFQHATEAGNLNVAKEALKLPNYPITDAYQQDFTGLTDTTVSGMDLLAYNRVVGQAYLVAMNALADRLQGTPTSSPSATGLNNAAAVAAAANGGSGSNVGIGQSLYQLFSVKNSSNALFQKFSYVANSNSSRMMGSDAQLSTNYTGWDISFMGAPTTTGGQGDPTNVYVSMDSSATNLPYIGDTGVRASDPTSQLYGTIQGTLNSQTTNPAMANSFFLAGYTAMNFSAAGVSWTLYGVPVYPNNQPHHVSGRDFYAAQSQWGPTFAPGGQGIVPPNAFKSVAGSVDKSTNTQAGMEAYSIVGVQNQTYQAQIPNGFIVVYNPAGIAANGYQPQSNVFGNELMTGIFLGTTSGGQTVFSTDQTTLDNWIAYNNGTSPSQPPLMDSNNNPIMYVANPDGTASPVNSSAQAGTITAAGGANGGGPSMTSCMWYDAGGSTADATCQGLLAPFESAFPDSVGPTTGTGPQLMAVEQLKEGVIRAYASPQTVNCPSNPTGLRAWVDAGGTVDPNSRSTGRPVPRGASAQISVDGTLPQLLNETAGTMSPSQSATVLNQIGQRMTEIDPATTLAQATNWITTSSTPIPMSSTPWYIYHTGAPGVSGWVLSQTPPPGLHGSTPAADGSLQRYSTQYQTINNAVNPLHEVGIHQQLFTEYPSIAASPGFDVVDWQPSSGYGNMLGQVTFWNYCADMPTAVAGGEYSQPD